MSPLLLPFLLLAADTGGAAVRAQPPAPVVMSAQDRWLGEDKFKHLAFSYVITASTFGAARAVMDHDASVTAGLAAGIAAGVLKEIYDQRTGRSASLRDLIFDAVGVAAAVVVVRQTR